MSGDVDPPGKVTLAELKRSVQSANDVNERSNQKDFEERFTRKSVRSEIDYEHLLGLQSHYWHKRNWSYFLMGAMAFMIIFQSILLLLVGVKVLIFIEYEWLLPALLVQNLAQIIGLAVIVVRSLFVNMNFPSVSGAD